MNILTTAECREHMHRRHFLSVAGCALVGTAGCLGGDTPATSDGIASTDFVVRDDGQIQPEADARVEFRPAENQVIVRGAMPAGNPCDVATLQSATFDPIFGRLTLTIGTKPTGDVLKRVLGCPDSLRIANFTATITMEETVPQTVSVTEIAAPLANEQTTTVRRNSQ